MSHQNPKYLAWVRTQPCSWCGNPESEPHHIIGIGLGGMALKADDIHTMPLCRKHHDTVHRYSDDYQVEQLRWLIRTQSKAQSEGIL